MGSQMHGGRFKLYGTNITFSAVTEISDKVRDGFEVAVELKEIDFLMADVAKQNSTIYSSLLYNYNTVTQTSEYNPVPAAALDVIAPKWQLGTFFYYGSENYQGKVPVTDALELFPNRINLSEFGYNTIYMSRDDLDDYWGSYLPSSNNHYSINKTTKKVTTRNGFNFIRFSNDTAGHVWSNMYFYNTTSEFGQLFGETYAPSGSANGWILGSSVTYRGGLFASSSIYKSIDPDYYVESVDPYNNGGTSGNDSTTGKGGQGNFDSTSDSVDFPELPTLSASDTGFITLFSPTIGQLKALSSYMWSDLFSLDSFKKVFADPMDAILGLSIIPVRVPESGSGQVVVGNISTSVTMTKADSQFVEVDCGTLNVKEFWGGYLDYDPYTKADIYLPYCGIHPLKTDDIMNKAIHLKYHVDILSGACVAYLKCGDSVLYTFSGACSCSIPITGDNFTNVINGVLSVASTVGTMVATGGLSAPLSAGLAAGSLSGVASTAANVMNMKPTVERSGSVSGMSGIMGIQTPYLILTRPNQCLPENQNSIEGYPSYITRTVSSLTGFTIFENIRLENMSCTDSEKEEIEEILTRGVVL